MIVSGPGRFSLHATTVSMNGRALAIAGPAGAGKSSTAAQMMVAGAALIVDDLTILTLGGVDIVASAPERATAAMELRGIGLVPVRLAPPAPLAGVLWLSPEEGPRLPTPERLPVGGVPLPLLRHPARPDLAAKLLIWMTSTARGEM